MMRVSVRDDHRAQWFDTNGKSAAWAVRLIGVPHSGAMYRLEHVLHDKRVDVCKRDIRKATPARNARASALN